MSVVHQKGAGNAVSRMNHAVLHARDVERRVDFYRDGKAAFLQAAASNNDHDLGLHHLAWEVTILDGLECIAGKLTESEPSSARPTVAAPRRCTPRTLTASNSASPRRLWSNLVQC